MNGTLKRKLAVGTTLVAATAFAGGAYAASKVNGSNERQAFLNDVAKRLNVSPAQLKGALQGAFDDRLQAAVQAGKLTQAQADAIKQHVQKDGVVPFGSGAPMLRGGGIRPFKGAPGFAHGGRLSAAAGYLGISEARLLDQLQAGKSLAQVASSQGKSVSGLKAAMTAAIKARLDKAVAAKMLSSAQEQQILSGVSSRLDAEINGKGFGPHHGLGRIGPHGFFGHTRGGMRAFPSYPVPPNGAPPAPGPVYFG